MKRFWWLIVVLAIAAAAFFAYFCLHSSEAAVKYRLAKVEEGPIVSAVTASGTLNAVITVQVGSQLSGQIKELLADFNTKVKAGQILARLDSATLEAKKSQAEADLEAARASFNQQKAQVEKAKAEVETARAALANAKAMTERATATLEEAKREHKRQAALLGRGVSAAQEAEKAQTALQTSQADLTSSQAQEESAAAALLSAKASVKVAEAQLAAAAALIRQRKAALKEIQVELDQSVITSPIECIVIHRNVDVGQTVAASFQAPTLFTIAQNLRQMEVWANVDETDIGRVAEGMPTSFTVDAYPGVSFPGRVKMIRLQPQNIQNVVTYTVIISAENPEGKLLPGMTANVQIISERREKVLKVPNTALRFRPAGAAEVAQSGQVWVIGLNGQPKAVAVRLGLGDGSFTEIESAELKAGSEVIIGTERAPTPVMPPGPRLGF